MISMEKKIGKDEVKIIIKCIKIILNFDKLVKTFFLPIILKYLQTIRNVSTVTEALMKISDPNLDIYIR